MVIVEEILESLQTLVGHSLCETLPVSADQEGEEEGGPRHGDEAHKKYDATPSLDFHGIMAHYAQLHWDIQKCRIAINNRIDQMKRDEVPNVWIIPLEAMAEPLQGVERGAKKRLEELGKQHFMTDWVQHEAPGLGLTGFAMLVGITGPLDRFGTVSKLWKYMGLHVTSAGTHPRPKKGAGGPNSTNPDKELLYSRKGPPWAYNIGNSIICHNKGRYRAHYDRMKEYYELNRPDWPQMQRHSAARRYAVKMLLKDMWVEWRRRVR